MNKFIVSQKYIVSKEFHCTVINTNRLNKWGTINPNNIIECIQTGLGHLTFKVLTSSREIRVLSAIAETSLVPYNKFFCCLYNVNF